MLLTRIRRCFVGARRDSGSALVAVIGIASVTAVIVVGLLASTVFATGHTSSGRAAVDARSAAESGVDYSVQAVIDGAACTSTKGYVSGSSPRFSTEVQYYDLSSAAWFYACTPLPATVSRLKVISTGFASSGGALNSSGDTRTVEAVYNISVTPKVGLDKAIFSGANATLSTRLEVKRDPSAPATPADVYAGGNYDCSTYGNVDGSIYVKGDFIGKTDCKNTGDVIVQKNMTCHSTLTIGGNLYVHGQATWTDATCWVKKNVMVKQNFFTSNSFKVGGNVSVGGAFSSSDKPNIAGTVTASAFTGNGADLFKASFPTRVQVPQAIGTIPNFDITMEKDFPKFDVAWLADTFSTTKGWTWPGWKATVKPLQKATGHEYYCSADGGSGFIDLVITKNTVLDSRTDCGSSTKIGGGQRIVLNADLVILATNLVKAGDLTVVSGDGKEHAIYFMTPWTTGDTTCDSSGTNMVFSWGKFSQPDGKTRALFYAPKGFKVETADTDIRGQIYACQVNLAEGMDIVYAPVDGAFASDAKVSAVLEYIRDAA